MAETFDDCEYVAIASRGHVWRARHLPEGKPIFCDGEAALRYANAEQPQGSSTPAKCPPGAPLRVLHNSYAVGFTARAAYDRRCYLVGLTAIGFGLLLMLLALLWLGPGWLRPAAPHIALDDPPPYVTWCAGFGGLSCCYDSRYVQTTNKDCVDVAPHH